jgi:phosphoglycerate kinase
VSSKITVIENILDKVDHMIIGGGMTFTFVKAVKLGILFVKMTNRISLEILRLAKEKEYKFIYRLMWLRQMRFQMMPKLKS